MPGPQAEWEADYGTARERESERARESERERHTLGTIRTLIWPFKRGGTTACLRNAYKERASSRADVRLLCGFIQAL